MQIYSQEHLEKAWHYLTINPRTKESKCPPVGVDGMRADKFKNNLAFHFAEILRLLSQVDGNGEVRYSFAPLLEIEKLKAGGGARSLYIPRLRDQLVYRMMHDDLVRCFDRINTASPSLVIDQLRKEIHETQPKYSVKADLKQFFSSVPRKRLLTSLTQEENLHPITLKLLKKWSNSLIIRPAWSLGKSRDYAFSGLPQGVSISSPLSEYWGKLLDQNLSSKGIRFYRYVDDLLFLTETEDEAYDVLAHLSKAVKSLGLSLSLEKTSILPMDSGVPWLGLIHTCNEVRIEPQRRKNWLKRIAKIRFDTGQLLHKAQSKHEQDRAVDDFIRAMKNEARCASNFRLRWYAHIDDVSQWREIDQYIHQQVHSVYRQIKQPFPQDLRLPSVQKTIAMLRVDMQEKGTIC